MSSDEPQPRRTPVARERRAAEAIAERQRPPQRTAQAVGLLRMTTTTEAGYADVPELYGVLVQLTQLTDVTGQVVHQARQWLMGKHRAGRIGTDNGDDVGETIDALTAAIAQTRSLSTALDDAAGLIAHLTGPYAPDPHARDV